MAYSRNKMFFGFSTVVMACAALYIALSLLWNVSIPFGGKILFFIIIFLLSQSITLMRLQIACASSLPFFLLRIGGYASAVFILLGSFTFLRDILTFLLAFFCNIYSSERLMRLVSELKSEAGLLLVLCFSIVGAGLGMWATLRVPRVRRRDISLKNLPPALDGLKIVQLSDLHIGSTYKGAWLKKVVERANELDPDLILITGDLVDNTPDVLAEDMRPLTELRARLGVLVSVGNHEYYSGLMPWIETWRNMGLDVLLNQWKSFKLNGEYIIISGIADASARKYPGLLLPDARAARSGAPEGFFILMSHQPCMAMEHAKLGYDLQLSGHTHGGQYVFLFPLVSLLNKGYRSGLYTVGSMMLHVSPGTGLWGYIPMRIGAPSEISLLVLHSSKSGSEEKT